MITIPASRIRANAVPTASEMQFNALFSVGFQPVKLIPGNPRRIGFSIPNPNASIELHFSIENAYQFSFSGRPVGGIVAPLATYDTFGAYVSKHDIWIWYPFGVLPVIVTGFEYTATEQLAA
jgi:hypothetical protein